MEPESTSAPESHVGSPRARRGGRFVSLLFIIILVICAVGFYQLGRSAVFSEHPELAGDAQATAILGKIAQLIQLPVGETPTMATINDAAAAKKAQPFLTNATNGDVLIIYPNAKTAILYRPSTNKLIAVGPVNTEQGGQTAGQTQGAPESAVASTTIQHETTTPKK